MKYLSLFSGIEAATVAWKPLGWQPVAFAEIEPFPCALLAHHYPNIPNLGSVTEITSEQIAALGHIDLVVGGSPCQDLSIAGKRAGFSGERSSLFYEQMRIFHAARTFCGARWLVWENVPGAFSSQHGRDFAAVVGEMAGCQPLVPEKGWSREGVAIGSNGLLEWAVLDAQWFGVAQRRRRVFAVLDTGAWERRPPVLFEPESLRRDHRPSREAGQEVTKSLAGSTGQRLDSEGLATTAYSIHPHCIGRSPNAGPQGREWMDDGSAYCLDGRGQAQAIAFPANMSGTQRATTTNLSPSLCAKNPTAIAFGVGGNGDLGHCLRSGASRADKADSTTYIVEASFSYGIPGNWIGRAEKNGGNATQPPLEVSPCLTKTDRHGVATGVFFAGQGAKAGSIAYSNSVAPTLKASDSGTNRTPSVHIGMQVRRLTPRECERLQGFQWQCEPDDPGAWQDSSGRWWSPDYTVIPYRKKPADQCPDSPRYKALGNSMAVPVMRWIGERIKNATMGE